MNTPDIPYDTPLIPAPAGFTTDFSNQGYASTLRTLIIALLILNTLFTAARAYTRAGPLKHFGFDDGLIIAAWMAITAHMGVTLDALDHGFGYHLWDIRVANYPHLYKDFFVLEVFSTVVYCTLKLGFLFTYDRIFSPTKAYKWAIWGGIVVCFLFYFGSFWWLIFKCSPIAASWDASRAPGAKCANEFVPGGETGVFNVISDIYILLLPIPMVWRLNTSKRSKLRLLAVFAVGIFAIVTSIVRLAQTVVQAKNPDAFYALGTVDIWALLEYSVGLWVVCSLVFTALWNLVLAEPMSKIWSSVSWASQSLLTSTQKRSQYYLTEISASKEDLPLTSHVPMGQKSSSDPRIAPRRAEVGHV